MCGPASKLTELARRLCRAGAEKRGVAAAELKELMDRWEAWRCEELNRLVEEWQAVGEEALEAGGGPGLAGGGRGPAGAPSKKEKEKKRKEKKRKEKRRRVGAA